MKVRSLPLGLVRLISAAASPFHPGVGDILSWAIYSDTVNESYDAAPLLARFPFVPTRFEDWVREKGPAASA